VLVFAVLVVFVKFMSMDMTVAFLVRMGTRMNQIFIVIVVVVTMSMSTQSPDEETDAGNNQNYADDVPLLRLERLSKLKSNGGDDATQHNGREHMPDRGKQASACRAKERPSLCPSNHSQRHPVVGQN